MGSLYVAEAGHKILSHVSLWSSWDHKCKGAHHHNQQLYSFNHDMQELSKYLPYWILAHSLLFFPVFLKHAENCVVFVFGELIFTSDSNASFYKLVALNQYLEFWSFSQTLGCFHYFVFLWDCLHPTLGSQESVLSVVLLQLLPTVKWERCKLTTVQVMIPNHSGLPTHRWPEFTCADVWGQCFGITRALVFLNCSGNSSVSWFNI